MTGCMTAMCRQGWRRVTARPGPPVRSREVELWLRRQMVSPCLESAIRMTGLSEVYRTRVRVLLRALVRVLGACNTTGQGAQHGVRGEGRGGFG